MKNAEAQEIIHAGLVLESWTSEQKSAMRVALDCMEKMEKIDKEASELYDGGLDLTDFGERILNIV